MGARTPSASSNRAERGQRPSDERRTTKRGEANPIYWIGGSKGGKSIMTFAVLDWLLGKEEPVVLVESNNSNPDVCKAYGACPSVHAEPLDLDEVDGWIELVNLCQAHRGAPVVVNRRRDAPSLPKRAVSNAHRLWRRTATFVLGRRRDADDRFLRNFGAFSAEGTENDLTVDDGLFARERAPRARRGREVEG